MTTVVALTRAPRPAPWPGDLSTVPDHRGAQRALVLLELSQHGPCDAVVLADRCGLGPADVLTHLHDLAGAGYVTARGPVWSAGSLVERHHRRVRAAG